MPRKRNKENVGLPNRWRFTRGAYYYQVRDAERQYFDDKRTFRLGRTLAAAHDEFSKRLRLIPTDEQPAEDELRTVVQMLDWYERDVVPTKAPRTQIDNHAYVVELKKFFGSPPALIVQVKARHAFAYFNWRRKKGAGKRRARLEVALLSHAFTRVMRKGVPGLDIHPFIDKVRFEGPEETSQPRERYIEDWELEEALKLKPRRKYGSVRMLQAYIRIKYITGLRRADMLRLRVTEISDDQGRTFKGDGIFVKARKTAKTTGHRKTILWTEELQDALRDAVAARPVDFSPWVFCDKAGECYVDERGLCSGFDSVWQRFVDRVIAETKVTERFQEKDIRGKTGSDSESDQEAAKLLGNDVKIARRHYRRRGEKVRPLR